MAELAPKVLLLSVASKLQLVPRKIVGRPDKEPGCGAVDKDVIQTRGLCQGTVGTVLNV